MKDVLAFLQVNRHFELGGHGFGIWWRDRSTKKIKNELLEFFWCECYIPFLYDGVLQLFTLPLGTRRGINRSHTCIVSILSHEVHLGPQELGHAVVVNPVGDGNGIACGYFSVRTRGCKLERVGMNALYQEAKTEHNRGKGPREELRVHYVQ